jgi:hypothetical protein
MLLSVHVILRMPFPFSALYIPLQPQPHHLLCPFFLSTLYSSRRKQASYLLVAWRGAKQTNTMPLAVEGLSFVSFFIFLSSTTTTFSDNMGLGPAGFRAFSFLLLLSSPPHQNTAGCKKKRKSKTKSCLLGGTKKDKGADISTRTTDDVHITSEGERFFGGPFVDSLSVDTFFCQRKYTDSPTQMIITSYD